MPTLLRTETGAAAPQFCQVKSRGRVWFFRTCARVVDKPANRPGELYSLSSPKGLVG